MATYRVIITPRAAADLEGVHDWIARHSRDSGAAMVQRILDALEPLKAFPHRTVVAHQNPRLRHPVRSLAVWPYVIYFRVLDDEKIVRVLHVRHGARRRPKRLG
jgi:plasmid stabilization system protein ParE